MKEIQIERERQIKRGGTGERVEKERRDREIQIKCWRKGESGEMKEG